MASSEYGAGQIQVLEGLEPVRKRPGMYIGSTGPRGLHHLVYEVVDNSVDEALAGACTEIQVTIHEDNSVTVEDNGRGIPVEIHPKEQMPTVEVVLTILHAGGKFDNEGYKVSGGLHGVGVSVVNALSTRTEVRVRRDGKEYLIAFERGKTVQKLQEIGPADHTGTTVTFWPDPQIFTETTVFDYGTLASRFREMAFLNKGLRITFTDERIPEKPAQPAEADADAAEETAENAASAPQRTPRCGWRQMPRCCWRSPLVCCWCFPPGSALRCRCGCGPRQPLSAPGGRCSCVRRKPCAAGGCWRG